MHAHGIGARPRAPARARLGDIPSVLQGVIHRETQASAQTPSGLRRIFLNSQSFTSKNP